jgi:predicted dehydrogenase
MKRIALVALGDHALQSHLKPLLQIEGIEISGAFDPSDEAFARAENEYGSKLDRFDTFEDILADKNTDAVLIASPDRFHLPQLEAAVQAGKHAFCEKPLCSNKEELVRLAKVLELAQENGLVVTSCHPRRFDTPYVGLKEDLENLKAEFGNVLEVKLDFTYHEPAAEKRHLHGDSMLQDHMNHEIDYLHFLCGHSNFTAHKLLDEHDRYHAAGVRDDGIIFNFMGTRRLPTRSYAESIHIRFETGEVHVDTYSKDRSFIYDHRDFKGAYAPYNNGGQTDYDSRFAKINQNWVDTMNGVGENYLTNKDMMINSYLSVAFAKNSSVRYEF